MQRGNNSNAMGVDLSVWDTLSDINVAKASGEVRFGILRATYSTTIRDRKFLAFVQAFTGAEIPLSAYHFAVPVGTNNASLQANAKAQAKYFIDTVNQAGGFQKFAIAPMLDWEFNPNNLTAPQLEVWITQWLADVEAACGRKPLIYTYPDFWRTQMNNTQQFSDYALAIADYGVSQPPNIGGWTRWTLWQFTDKANIPGFPGAVDRDEVAGSLSVILVQNSLQATGFLQTGSTGAAVIALQNELNKLGAKPVLTIDGKYGPATQAAVEAFQKTNHLTVDGIAGPITLKALDEALAKQSTPPMVLSAPQLETQVGQAQAALKASQIQLADAQHTLADLQAQFNNLQAQYQAEVAKNQKVVAAVAVAKDALSRI